MLAILTECYESNDNSDREFIANFINSNMVTNIRYSKRKVFKSKLRKFNNNNSVFFVLTLPSFWNYKIALALSWLCFAGLDGENLIYWVIVEDYPKYEESNKEMMR